VRCIWNLRKKYITTGTTQDKPCSGRLSMLLLLQKKIIYRKARAAPKIEYSELAVHGVLVNPDGTTLKPPSKTTLWRALKSRGLTNHCCKKRPKFTRAHALKCLQFCREYRTYPWSWRTLKFSDECSVQKGSGANQEWCFWFPWEKWKKEMITTISTSRKPAQMVWAAIWLDKRKQPRRSKLVIMEHDFNTKKHGYLTKSYMKALNKDLLPHWRCSQLFMQDNAGIHCVCSVLTYLQCHRINTITWPAYSPNLNPIEHLWWQLKKHMYRLYPQFNNFSRAEEEWEGFCNALQECWAGILGTLIKQLIMSMPHCMAACRCAQGWQTKY
jgi:transposase